MQRLTARLLRLPCPTGVCLEPLKCLLYIFALSKMVLSSPTNSVQFQFQSIQDLSVSATVFDRMYSSTPCLVNLDYYTVLSRCPNAVSYHRHYEDHPSCSAGRETSLTGFKRWCCCSSSKKACVEQCSVCPMPQVPYARGSTLAVLPPTFLRSLMQERVPLPEGDASHAYKCPGNMLAKEFLEDDCSMQRSLRPCSWSQKKRSWLRHAESSL